MWTPRYLNDLNGKHLCFNFYQLRRITACIFTKVERGVFVLIYFQIQTFSSTSMARSIIPEPCPAVSFARPLPPNLTALYLTLPIAWESFPQHPPHPGSFISQKVLLVMKHQLSWHFFPHTQCLLHLDRVQTDGTSIGKKASGNPGTCDVNMVDSELGQGSSGRHQHSKTKHSPLRSWHCQ